MSSIGQQGARKKKVVGVLGDTHIANLDSPLRGKKVGLRGGVD